MKVISSRNLFFYSLLLILTPFILLQNYFQWAIATASKAMIEIAGLRIPLIIIIAVLLVSFLIIFTYKTLSRKRLLAFLGIIVMWQIGQNSTDFYFGHTFYELQHNWHYLAYGIFAYIIYRFLIIRGKKDYQIIRISFLAALLLSTFDELIQIPLSNRIFDICDIGKDVWGVSMGLVFVFFVVENGKITQQGWRIWRNRIRDYLVCPWPLLVFQIILSYVFLATSSLLSETDYTIYVILITLLIFFTLLMIIHFLQYKRARWFIMGLGVLMLGYLSFSLFTKKTNPVRCTGSHMIVFKGVPLPFFDVMINPNGSFRFVDKKKDFNTRDKNTIFKRKADIVVFGTGENQRFDIGFSKDIASFFEYSKVDNRIVQIIILNSADACKAYNEYKNQGRKVMLILHQE